MTSSYPSSKDTFSRTTPSSSLSGHSDLHDEVSDAVENIQDFVGVSGDTTAGTIVKRVSDLEAAPPAHNHDATYYTETEVDALLSGKLGTTAKAADSDKLDGQDGTYYAIAHSHPYVETTYNSSLNSDTRNSRGVTRLYRKDSNDDYSVQTWWDGSRWVLEGFQGDSYHAQARVAYSDYAASAGSAGSATSATSAGNADTVDSLHAASFLRSDADDIGSGKITLTNNNLGSDYSNCQLIVAPANDAGIAIRTGNNNAYTVQLRAGGGAAGNRLYVMGHKGSGSDAYYANISCLAVTETSALRFKKDVETVYAPSDSDAIDLVKQIDLSSFAWKNDESNKRLVGVIADDLVDVFPEAVQYDDDGLVSGIETQRIVYASLGALRQAINKIETLEARIAELEG